MNEFNHDCDNHFIEGLKHFAQGLRNVTWVIRRTVRWNVNRRVQIAYLRIRGPKYQMGQLIPYYGKDAHEGVSMLNARAITEISLDYDQAIYAYSLDKDRQWYHTEGLVAFYLEQEDKYAQRGER